jgi:hypothetical protein
MPAVAPVPLSYDDLPPGSDIRRERDGDGTLRIIVPASDVPAEAERRVLRDSFVWGALGSPLLLLPALVLFRLGIWAHRVSGGPLVVAWIAFGVFCCALVALIAHSWKQLLMNNLRSARMQRTAIAATPTRLIVETTGPFGFGSYDVKAEQLRTISLRRCWLSTPNLRARVSHLRVELRDGSWFALLPGRDRAELMTIAAMLRACMALSDAQQTSPESEPS